MPATGVKAKTRDVASPRAVNNSGRLRHDDPAEAQFSKPELSHHNPLLFDLRKLRRSVEDERQHFRQRGGSRRRRGAPNRRLERAGATRQSDTLPAVDFPRNRWSHTSAQAGLDLHQLLTGIGAICNQTPVGNHLENQVAGGWERPSPWACAALRLPPFLL